MMKNKFLVLLAHFCLIVAVHAQQVADTAYNPIIGHPAYPSGEGPVLAIDEGHHNFHTKDGRYLPFARLVERDGYTVMAHKGKFTAESLANIHILVISNALNEASLGAWYNPTLSAFTPKEIAVVQNWVREGGRLFLIADHMPMGGAAIDLAAAFEFEFTNGFAVSSTGKGTTRFTRANQTLTDNELTNRASGFTVDSIVSFTGQAFQYPESAEPILVFDEGSTNYLPDTAWQFTETTPAFPIDQWAQGAYRNYGDGKVVVFGEAAMFSAQLAGEQQFKAGMNSDLAPNNYKLLLNIIRWLDDE